jgi:putative serine protease PepD
VLATALVAGSVGGVVGARSDGERSMLDPSASLGSGTSSSASLSRDPESVAGIAARVMRSTVSIAVQGAEGNGTGSGVVIRSDGYILTNNHVVESAAGGGEITVTLDAGEQEIPAEIVGRDPVTDLAVLQVRSDGGQLPAATLGQSRALVVGDLVIAIGSPLGLSGTVTTGIVSALNRTVDVPGEGGARNPLFNAIQTDAAINPGNSGGALVNARGEVVGINSAIATLGAGGPFGGQQGGSIGVGFAIPIDEAKSVAEEIIRTGKATHPSIGVSATTVSGEDREGALVRELTSAGAASRAGLQPGDLIVKVDGEDVTSVDELILAVRRNKIGDTVSITYLRDGRTRTADLVLQDLRRN